jgi:hypothetical protein
MNSVCIMLNSKHQFRQLMTASLLAVLLFAQSAYAGNDDDDEDEEDDEEVTEVVAAPSASKPDDDEDEADEDSGDNKLTQIGAVQNKLRQSRKQTSFLGKVTDDYSDFTSRMEEDYGLSWSFSLSYRQRWYNPSNIGTSAQTLFWPALNWDIFDSETFGAGSFQYLYYGERRSKAKISVDRRFRTLSGEIPDEASQFSQITYTHTLPGERLAIAVGQFSFFNFDSNDYLADQQINFVNSIFSSNGSSSYAATGIGAYLQFNATKTLQILIGEQSINKDDSGKRPASGFSNSPYSHLGYIQWKPQFKNLGAAQYSLTLYDVPAMEDKTASKGWSLNAMQNISDSWAIFARANASQDQANNSKRSYALGVALNNPFGRDAGDQIGLAFGSLNQKAHLLNRALEHKQDTLEAYCTINLLPGLFLTPDIQYIHNPAFAPQRNHASIFSLRTMLVF